MPDKAYKLRAELLDSFVGGSVISGPSCGTVDLKEELSKGDGVIKTADVHLQGVLDNFYGIINGSLVLVFDAHTVDEETGNLIKIEPPAIRPMAVAPRPDLLIPLASGAPGDPGVPVHEHDGYSGLMLDELEDIATERGLAVPAGASDSDIIAILEAHDEEEGK